MARLISFCILVSLVLTSLSLNVNSMELSGDHFADEQIIVPQTWSVTSLVINEFLADPASDWDGDSLYNFADDEWVEIYNPTSSPIDASGCYLGDEINPLKSELPGGSMIPPSGYLIMYGSTNNAFGLNNGGDTVYLTAPDSTTEIDNHTYTASADDVSEGRWPDGSQVWVQLDPPTPNATNGFPPDVVINEVLYDPDGTEIEGEWIEVYNKETTSINMSQWELEDQDGNVYIFPDLMFPSETYIVIHTGEGSDDTDFSDGIAHLHWNETSSVWTNTGDDVLLSHRSGVGIDYMAFEDGSSVDEPPVYMSWTGPNASASEGETIARVPNGIDTNAGADWNVIPTDNITMGWSNDMVFAFDLGVEVDEQVVTKGGSVVYNITVNNRGSNLDTFELDRTDPPQGWSADLNRSSVLLGPGSVGKVTLTITAPPDLTYPSRANVNISATSVTGSITRTISTLTTIPSVDLEFTSAYIEHGASKVTIADEGDILEISTTLKNKGDADGGAFTVGFYMDSIEPSRLLETKSYDYIKPPYSKYPKADWDTLGSAGEHVILVVADPQGVIEETDESNNIVSLNITINSTAPSSVESEILLTRVYYDSKLSYDPDEFVTIYNPTDAAIDIGGWEICDNVELDVDETISFPAGSTIGAKESVTIVDDPEPYYRYTLDIPEYACEDSQLGSIIMEQASKWPGFSNTGDEVVLRTDHRQIIDIVTYEASKYSGVGWNGRPANGAREGNVLLRQFDTDTGGYVDTDSASDWESLRKMSLGQSDFPLETFSSNGPITAFVSPDSSFASISSAIDTAQKSIWLNLYQFTSEPLCDYLVDAMERGVDLWMLLEGYPVGGISQTQKILTQRLVDAGAVIHFMISDSDEGIIPRYNFNHAKYAVIDNVSLLLGSENWKPSGIPLNTTYGNRGWGIKVVDDKVASYFAEVFWADFSPSRVDIYRFNSTHQHYGGPYRSSTLYDEIPTSWYEPKFPAETFNEPCEITPVLAPDTSLDGSGILGIISGAKDTVLVEQLDCNINWTYNDAPMDSLYLEACIDAARRGVDVKILLDSLYVTPWDDYEDNADTVKYINALAREEGISDRLEARLIYLGGIEKLHNKGLLVDSEHVLISSINWNYNSVTRNREAGLIIKSGGVAKYYEEVFNQDWESSTSYVENATPSDDTILFTQVYYDGYLPGETEEFVAITNPTEMGVDIGGWQISDSNSSRRYYDWALIFPLATVISGGETFFISYDASSFQHEMGFLPDLEYGVFTSSDIGHLMTYGEGMDLVNTKDEIFLKDANGYVIDAVVYGGSEYLGEDWWGAPVDTVKEGVILMRSQMDGAYVDTDSAADWESIRERRPGQSNFNSVKFTADEVHAFVSPDASHIRILSALDSASESIDVCVYQFTSFELAEHLVNASSRGVNVRVLLEGGPVGGLTDEMRAVALKLFEGACDVRFMITDADNDIHDRYTFLHSKYMIIDESLVGLGSENWKRTGIPADPSAGNRGWGVIVKGQELAGYLRDVFNHDWNPLNADSHPFDMQDREYGPPIEEIDFSRDGESDQYLPRFGSISDVGKITVEPVLSPDHSVSESGSIIGLLRSAESSILVEQLDCNIEWSDGINYSFDWGDPGSYYLKWSDGKEYHNLYLVELIEAARRGVDVKVLLDSRFIFDYSEDNQETVEYLQKIAEREGIDMDVKLIYLDGTIGLNRLTLLHNKGIIVDNERTLISSINWARGSALGNREMGIIIESEKVANYFIKIFSFDWNLTVDQWLDAFFDSGNVHTIRAGASTEYIITIENEHHEDLVVTLSPQNLQPEWSAHFDEEVVEIAAGKKETVTLTVTPDPDLLEGSSKILIQATTKNMSADIAFMITTIGVHDDEDIQEDDNTSSSSSGSFFEDYGAWIAILCIIVGLVLGAVVRDIITARMKKRKEGISCEDEKEEQGTPSPTEKESGYSQEDLLKSPSEDEEVLKPSSKDKLLSPPKTGKK